jgi:hypothetical protein
VENLYPKRKTSSIIFLSELKDETHKRKQFSKNNYWSTQHCLAEHLRCDETPACSPSKRIQMNKRAGNFLLQARWCAAAGIIICMEDGHGNVRNQKEERSSITNHPSSSSSSIVQTRTGGY